MAEYCVVAPPQILEDLSIYGWPRHHLLLAHDIVVPTKTDTYRSLFNNPVGYQLPRDFVILDNSVVELGKPVELDMIVEAAKVVKPDCIVLPDAYLDSDATIANCRKAIEPWSEAFESGQQPFDDCEVPFMFLPQGKTKDDFLRCALEFATHRRIRWWGIPRNIVEYHGSRQWAIDVLHAIAPWRKIHLFGFSDNLVDDMICAQDPRVFSIDSAVPVRCNHYGLKFTLRTKMPPRGNWWEAGTYTPGVKADIEQATSIFGGRGMK